MVALPVLKPTKVPTYLFVDVPFGSKALLSPPVIVPLLVHNLTAVPYAIPVIPPTRYPPPVCSAVAVILAALEQFEIVVFVFKSATAVL